MLCERSEIEKEECRSGIWLGGISSEEDNQPGGCGLLWIQGRQSRRELDSRVPYYRNIMDHPKNAEKQIKRGLFGQDWEITNITAKNNSTSHLYAKYIQTKPEFRKEEQQEHLPMWPVEPLSLTKHLKVSTWSRFMADSHTCGICTK